MYYVNENIRDLYRVFDQNSRDGFLRLDLNENPGSLPEEFVREVLDHIDGELIAKYPEHKEFMEILAGFIHMKPEEICLTNGSAEAIRNVIEVFSRPGGKIVSVEPSYAMYHVFSKMYGRVHVPVPYNKNMQIDVNDILNAIDDDVNLVIILNPNNPIGDVHSKEEVDAIIQKARKHCAMVLIDEAYFYFYPHSLIEFVRDYDNVLLTRTFSKAFSLAGCRLGYIVGNEKSISLIQKNCTPHNINVFGMRFAQAIIQKENMLDRLVGEQLEGKAFLIEQLGLKAYTVKESEGNFVFIKPKTDAKSLVEKLKENKILVKYYDNELLGEYIRVTIGKKSIMEIFIEFLDKLDI